MPDVCSRWLRYTLGGQEVAEVSQGSSCWVQCGWEVSKLGMRYALGSGVRCASRRIHSG
jgi:hypothetical protein